MKKLTILGTLILVLALGTTTYGVPPGQPFQELLDLINSLAARVTALETSGGGGATRSVFQGTIDLDSTGDEVRTEAPDSQGVVRTRHFKTFVIPDLSLADPPAVTLFQRRRTDLAVFTTTGFFVGGLANNFRAENDITNVLIEEGQILLQFRVDRSNATPLYGLDGPGGTGEFRLVLIR